MEKIINITIGGVIFNIEEEAYTKLSNYIKAIKKHFTSLDSSDEIIDDMEARMAEHFEAKRKKNRHLAIKEADVDQLIEIMGTIEDFDKESEDLKEEENTENVRKLYRNTDDKVIAGVCSGIGAYLGIDATIIRILFLIGIFFGGFSIPLYIVMFLLMPEANTTIEKMQMRGKPITLSSIEETIRSQLHNKQHISKLKHIFSKPFELIAFVSQGIIGIIKKLWPIAMKIIGVILGLYVGFFILALTFVFLNMVFNWDSPYIGLPFDIGIFGSSYYIILFSVFFAFFIPLLAILFVAISIILNRSIFNKALSFSLLGLWIIAAMATGVVGVKLAPQIQTVFEQSPSFHKITKNIEVSDFNKISVIGNDYIYIEYGEEFLVKVEGNRPDIDKISFGLENGELLINDNSNKEDRGLCIFCINEPSNIYIELPVLNSVIAKGRSDVHIENFQQNDLILEFKDKSHGNINVELENAELSLYENSRVELTGKAQNLKITAKDSSQLIADKFTSENIDIDATEAARLYVNPLRSLKLRADDASQIYYLGNPVIEENIYDGALLQNVEYGANYYDLPYIKY